MVDGAGGPRPGAQEHAVSPLPLGLDKLQLRPFLLTFFPEYFFKTKGNIDPALLTLHRRKCETSTAEVTLLSLPRASSRPPLLRENNADSSAMPRTREEGRKLHSPAVPGPHRRLRAGRARGMEREGWGTPKAFCSVPLVHFPFVYMTLYPGRVAGPPPAAAAPQGRHRAIRSITLFLSWLCIVVINTRSIC